MTQTERVLDMLRAHGKRGATTADFLDARIPRFSARLRELREAGHVIVSERLAEGSWRYELWCEADPEPRPVRRPPDGAGGAGLGVEQPALFDYPSAA